MCETQNENSYMDLYAMLGVTLNSPLVDVRHAYRNMARICHPDRGGDPADMRILKNAYDWIVYQLEHVALEGTKGSYEERENEFNEFMKKQQDIKMPSLNDIEIDTMGISESNLKIIQDLVHTYINTNHTYDDFYYNLTYRQILYNIMNNNIDISSTDTLISYVNAFLEKINMAIKNDENYTASIEGGYGNMIDTSLEPIDTPLKPEFQFGNKTLVLYNDQSAYTIVTTKHKSPDVYVDIPLPKKLEDYSVGPLCDYKQAFTSSVDESDQMKQAFESCTSKRTYDTLIAERNDLDMLLVNSIPEKVILQNK